ncbi:MAG: hypothetical protein M0Q13_01605 [Methanothrix sp.]|jgi:hypothetical protein|nr:hypothetical protein [Methanothrix sp.]
MGMLAKLIKTVISAVLLNKAVRSAFIVTLIKSVKWIIRPSTISRIMAFFSSLAKSAPGIRRSNFLASIFKGAAELALLRFAKRSGFSGPAALSALAALLMAMMRGREESPGASSKRQKDKIIDIDEYTIVDDRH